MICQRCEARKARPGGDYCAECDERLDNGPMQSLLMSHAVWNDTDSLEAYRTRAERYADICISLRKARRRRDWKRGLAVFATWLALAILFNCLAYLATMS